MGIADYILPCILGLVAIIILFSKKELFACFLKGAMGGVKSAFSLLPSMCALIVCVNMLFASGATEYFTSLFAPLFDKIGVPSELLQLVIVKPLSYGASLASFRDIASRCGVDSFPALCGSIILASTDTVFYVSCVYFSGTEIKKTRYFLPVALFVTGVSVFLSCILARLFF
jgi:spore maturation protein B